MRTQKEILARYRSAKLRKANGLKECDDTKYKVGCALVEVLRWILKDELDEVGHKKRGGSKKIRPRRELLEKRPLDKFEYI